MPGVPGAGKKENQVGGGPCAACDWVKRGKPVGSFGPSACADPIGPVYGAGPREMACLRGLSKQLSGPALGLNGP